MPQATQDDDVGYASCCNDKYGNRKMSCSSGLNVDIPKAQTFAKYLHLPVLTSPKKRLCPEAGCRTRLQGLTLSAPDRKNGTKTACGTCQKPVCTGEALGKD